MAKGPSFKVNKLDFSVISKIADRAVQLVREHHGRCERSRIDFQMDITAAHANGCPLQLQALLDADNFNFAHDVFGIERHLDRDTGRLLNHFLPRFARKQSRAAA